MATLKISHSYLEDLRSETKALVQGASALDGLFDKEETHLRREDGASTLRAAYRTIVEQLQELKHSEALASYGHSQANLVLFPVGLIITAMVSRGNHRSAITDYLLHGSADRQQPFGLVMVCIGLNGLPDGARAVSISQLARESNRSQPEIVSKLQDDGHLLVTEEAFSLLIDRLIEDIREGRLHLPVSRDRLVGITRLGKPKPGIKIIEVQ